MNCSRQAPGATWLNRGLLLVGFRFFGLLLNLRFEFAKYRRCIGGHEYIKWA